ncbi:MAG: hypothetical protein ACSHX6_12840 [Akkermansiaceae bacterium]
MELDLIELNRCRDAESVTDTTGPLDAANIAYKVGSTAVNFDISKIGTGDDPEVIISVRREDFVAARSVLEEEYSEYDLPDDHYLLNSSDEDLAEILANPSDWNAFDVVHARRLAEEQGVNITDIKQQKEKRLQKLKQGKPVSKALLFCGWIFAIFGGLVFYFGNLVGIGIACSICYMKEQTLDGEFYTYDAGSRDLGFPMLVVSIVMLFITFIGLFVMRY